jgi:DNA-directed RNA polymerase beta' subunit
MKEGLSPIEYFITTHGSRKGLSDTALNTAKAGYLTRRLFDVAQDVVSEEDCGTKEGLTIKRESHQASAPSLAQNITGRYLAADVEHRRQSCYKKGHFLTHKDAKQLKTRGAASVYVRSPIAANLRGLCAHCYGADLGTMKPVALGEAVGTVAAQAIGEPGTQLTMRTFHAGGAASVGRRHYARVCRALKKSSSAARRATRQWSQLSRAKSLRSKTTAKKRSLSLLLTSSTQGKGKKDVIEYDVHFRRVPLVKLATR